MSGPFGPQMPRPRPVPVSPPSPRSRALMITAIVLAIGFIFASTFAQVWTDKLWFESLGYSGVFRTVLLTQIGLFVVFGGLMGGFVGLNMWVAYRYRQLFAPILGQEDSMERYRAAVGPIRVWLVVAAAGVMGAFSGLAAISQWREFSAWRHSTDFGTKDPFFKKDPSFYVFELPWWHFVVDFVMAAALVGLMAAIAVHYVCGGIRLQAKTDKVSPAAQAQFSALAALFVVAKGVDYWLDRYDLLSSPGSLFSGMGYTDHNAVLPAKGILAGIALSCAGVFVVNIWRRTWLLSGVGISLLVLSGLLLGVLWPGVVQRFQVMPDQPDKEGPYIQKNIDATRSAYGLGDIEVKPYTSSPDLSTSLATMTEATAMTPLVDPKLVSSAFEQQQQVRAYYSVADVLDVDRYVIDGKERQLVLGVREMDQSGLAEADQNWANLHTVYTHGSGLIAAYANQRPEDDQRQASTLQYAEGREADESALYDAEPYEPRVYFGEKSPNYSIVGQSPNGGPVELDLPMTGDPENDEATAYDGRGGVAVGTLLRKSLYAVKFRDANLILSGRVHENSKILYDRHPALMVSKVAPWLTLDNDPYPAVVDGRIQWIIDGYTTTDQYPLSQRTSFDEMITTSLLPRTGFQTLPTDQINYMRNAVKATVDAYDGTVKLYAWDETDPVLKVWQAVFPGTVLDRDQIDESLMKHLRYPEDLFKAQRYQFARYHLENAKDWYEAGDRWQVPEDPNMKNTLQPPYRFFVGESEALGESPEDGVSTQTYSMSSTYVPFKKNNLAAYLSVNSDATSDKFGQMTALELPNEQTPGPGLIANEFAANDNVSKELLSFKNAGRTPKFGNLLTMPMAKGLMYIQPLYAARAETSTSSYPILQFVIVSYGGKVGIAPTLEGAIGRVLDQAPEPADPDPGDGKGDGTQKPETKPTGTVSQQVRKLLTQAETKFEEADRLQRNGDTVGWAKAMEEARALVVRAADLASQSKR